MPKAVLKWVAVRMKIWHQFPTNGACIFVPCFQKGNIIGWGVS